MHKWDSEDDDEGADIHSSSSKTQTNDGSMGSVSHLAEHAEQLQTFEGYGLDSSVDAVRYTGTFGEKKEQKSKI